METELEVIEQTNDPVELAAMKASYEAQLGAIKDMPQSTAVLTELVQAVEVRKEEL